MKKFSEKKLGYGSLSFVLLLLLLIFNMINLHGTTLGMFLLRNQTQCNLISLTLIIVIIMFAWHFHDDFLASATRRLVKFISLVVGSVLLLILISEIRR